eukprot:1260612-Rhodomonas_salina.1
MESGMQYLASGSCLARRVQGLRITEVELSGSTSWFQGQGSPEPEVERSTSCQWVEGQGSRVEGRGSQGEAVTAWSDTSSADWDSRDHANDLDFKLPVTVVDPPAVVDSDDTEVGVDCDDDDDEAQDADALNECKDT